MKSFLPMLVALAVAGCSGGMPRMPGAVPTTRIADVPSRTFTFGPTALGQERDVDFHRAVLSGLVPAPTLRKHLDGIVQRLLAECPVTKVPARVYVRATNIYGAESSGDANIYINYRTLERVESEDEMAAILAHELAHVVLGHPSADIVQDVQARLLQYTNMALAVHATVARQYGVGQGMGVHTAAVAGEALLLKLNQAVVGPYWVRTQEEEADLLGLDLLIRAGYDPRAMETTLDRLHVAESENLDERGFNDQLKTMFKEQWPELLAEGHDAVAKRVIGMWIDSVVKKMREDHPDTLARKELVRKYREKNYATAALRDPDTKGWHDAIRRKDKQTKRIFQSYSDAIQASARLLQGEKPEALKLATDAAASDMRDHAFVADALYRVKNALGERRDKSAQLFTGPIRGQEPAWLAFQELGFAQLGSGKRDAGIGTLERGYGRLQRPPHAIPPLLYAYERTGAKEKATALANDCALRFPSLESAGGCKAHDPNEKALARNEDRDDEPKNTGRAWQDYVPMRSGWGPRP